METSPTKPSLPDLGYEIFSPCPLTGAPLRFIHHQKLSPRACASGDPASLSRPSPSLRLSFFSAVPDVDGGRGPPQRGPRPELQAMSNSLQLT